MFYSYISLENSFVFYVNETYLGWGFILDEFRAVRLLSFTTFIIIPQFAFKNFVLH